MAVTWITEDDVVDFLGSDTLEVDDPWLVQVTAAANTWCYRRRAVAGYVDLEGSAPDDACSLATVLYAGSLYRERGAIDGYASVDDLGSFVPSGGTFARVKSLLGLRAAAVA